MSAADGALDSPSEKIIAKTSVAKPGVYSLLIRGSDEMGNVASEKSVVLVVYDPENGYVSGNGVLDSPAEAYVANPSLKGKATFRFSCKYEQGATTPSGQVEFVFPAAGLTFKSSKIDWVVVSGTQAQCKGSGTINGSGNFTFNLIVVDEKSKGKAGADKFRIEIWDKATGRKIYDNGLGGPEEISPTTSIVSGTVDIHNKSAKGKEH